MKCLQLWRRVRSKSSPQPEATGSGCRVFFVDCSWFIKSSYSSAGDGIVIFARCMGTLGNSLNPAAHAPLWSTRCSSRWLSGNRLRVFEFCAACPIAMIGGVKNPGQATVDRSKTCTTVNPPNARALAFPGMMAGKGLESEMPLGLSVPGGRRSTSTSPATERRRCPHHEAAAERPPGCFLRGSTFLRPLPALGNSLVRVDRSDVARQDSGYRRRMVNGRVVQSWSSSLQNHEVTAIFVGRAFGRQMADMFEDDFRRCRELSLASWRDRGWARRLREC